MCNIPDIYEIIDPSYRQHNPSPRMMLKTNSSYPRHPADDTRAADNKKRREGGDASKHFFCLFVRHASYPTITASSPFASPTMEVIINAS